MAKRQSKSKKRRTTATGSPASGSSSPTPSDPAAAMPSPSPADPAASTAPIENDDSALAGLHSSSAAQDSNAIDPAQVAAALEPRPAPEDSPLPDLTPVDLTLRKVLMQKLKELADESAGIDLRDLDFNQVEEADTSRFARMVYGMSYIRLLEALALPPRTPTARLDQARLGLAYIRHAETNDREMMRLNSANSISDEHCERAIVEMRKEVLRIASYRKATPNANAATESTG